MSPSSSDPRSAGGGRSHPGYLTVGRLGRPHGTRGHLQVLPLTDDRDDTFRPGVLLHVGDPAGDRPDPHYPRLEVEEVREHRKGLLVRFRGFTERSFAEPFSGRYLLRPFEETRPAAAGEYFYHELLGMRVVTVTGEEVGAVAEVYELEPHHLLEVARAGGPLLIPLARAVVVSVERDAGRIVIDPPEGLLEL